MVLVCFAVRQEARPFQKECAAAREGITVLITGMGKVNAERAVEGVLRAEKPELVLTCGFAGGLRPGLESGAVIYDAKGGQALEQELDAAGARKGRFAFSDRVATTAAEKQRLWQQTSADAVEMESQAVCAMCQRRGVPTVIVRVILDTAEEDLPLNFNELLTADQSMNYAKLAAALLRSPGKIRSLLRLQRQSRAAAERLGGVLHQFLRKPRNSP